MSAKLIQFPDSNRHNIPQELRNLADSIEAGKYGDAHTLAWVIDCGDARIEVGLLGAAAEAAPTAYFLLGLAQRRLEDI